MTNDDLERQLRSQRGPREDGYLPTNLPASLEHERPGGTQPSRLVRIGAFAGVAAAAALAVALLGGVFSGDTPGVGSGTSDEPSPSDVAHASACGPADVALTGEAWGGAAGSRGTNVTVALATGRYTCMLGEIVEARITDASGVTLVTTQPASQVSGLVLLASGGQSYTVGVAWSNWCGTPVAEPVTLALRFDGWAVPGEVTIPSGGTDPVPPCNGGPVSNLSVTGLQASY